MPDDAPSSEPTPALRCQEGREVGGVVIEHLEADVIVLACGACGARAIRALNSLRNSTFHEGAVPDGETASLPGTYAYESQRQRLYDSPGSAVGGRKPPGY